MILTIWKQPRFPWINGEKNDTYSTIKNNENLPFEATLKALNGIMLIKRLDRKQKYHIISLNMEIKKIKTKQKN